MSKFCIRAVSALRTLAANRVIRTIFLVLTLAAVLPAPVQAQFTLLKQRASTADGSDGFSPLSFANGKLFGTTRSGGTSGVGVIFSMNMDGTGYTVLHHFNNTDGSSAYGGVIVATDGKLYGTTYSSSTGYGTIYRLNADGTGFTTLRTLAPGDGQNSWAGLLQAADGKLYGAASSGGTNNRGTAFRLNLDGTGFTVLRNFDTAAGQPEGTLIQGLDGKLYGTSASATGGTGAIYRMSTDGTGFQILHVLVSTEGSTLRGGVMQTSDGKLYGTAQSGGALSGGSIFKLNPDGTGFTVMKSFSSTSTTEGSAPYKVVPALGSDGRIYGGNYLLSGVSQSGTIWSIAPDGTGFKIETTLSTATGFFPLAGVQKAPDGALYGQTYQGGSGSGGTIFRLTRPGIGVNFTGGQWALSATDQPGVQSGANWNNLGGTTTDVGAGVGSNIALTDHGTLATTARLTYRGAYDLGYGGYSGLNSSNAGTNKLYRGGIYGDDASREASATVTNIPYTYYDVYVYGSNEGSTNTLSISNGTSTYYSRGNGALSSSVTSLVETASTDSSNPTVGPAQYAVFRGLTSSSFTITTGGSVNGIVAASMLGFQIVPGTAPAVPAPSITSATTASATYNSSFSYQITASNSPTAFGATNLPAGLSVSASGLISGTVTAAAGSSYNIGITATNATGTGSATLVLTVNKASAAVVLSNLTQTYDGTTKSATVTTAPTGQAFDISYTGAVLPPVAAGSYGVLATIKSTSNYTGSASGTLAIQPAAATIALGSLAQFYDGSPKSVSATTTPPGLPVSITYNGSDTAPSSVGSYAIVATVTNPNYTGSATGTLTITDNVPPVLTLPTSPIVAEATSSTGASVTYAVSANDNVDGAVPVSALPASGSVFPIGNTTVTATATDAAGNIATGTFTVTVQDTTIPTFNAAADGVAEATSAAGAVVSFNASASDIVDGAVAVTATPASGSLFPLGDTAVALVTQDAAGNIATSSLTVSVVDTTKPTLTLPATVTAEATGPNGAAVSFNPTASDAVGVQLARADFENPVYSTDAHTYVAFGGAVSAGDWTFLGYGGVLAGSGGGFGPVTQVDGQQCAFVQSYYGTLSSLETSQTFSVVAGAKYVVQFQQATRAGYPGMDYNVTLNGPTGSTEIFRRSAASGEGWARYTATFTATTSGEYTLAFNNLNASDDATFFVDKISFYSTAVPVVTAPASGSTFALGTTSVSASATDAAGNAATGSFNVTVKDTTPPVIAVPADITAEATSASGAVVTFASSATDTVDGSVAVAAAPASGSTFPLGTTTVNLTTVDAHGNAATRTFAITVRDTTAPVIAPHADLIAEATSAAGAVVAFSANANDLVDGVVTVTASPASGSTFALGTTTVTLSATDAHNNTSTSTFTVTVKDTTAPTLTIPANQTLEATGPNGAVASYVASAIDAVTASPAIGYSVESGSTFPIGTTTITVSATDDAGNASTGSFTVTVQDTIAPAITAPASLVMEATSAAGAVATFTSSATDIVDGSVTVSSDIASGSIFSIGTTAVTLTATDAHGNSSHATFSVTVQDTTAPVIAAQDSLVVEATSANGAIANFTTGANDIVSGAVAVAASPASGSTFPLGTSTVTLVAVDAAGNSASSSFTVTVRDTTAPVLTVPANLTVEATSAAGANAAFAASATDAVSNVTLGYSIASGSTFALGTTTVNVTATDAVGNVSSGSFTVTVVDMTAPVIATQANLVIEATSAAGAVATFTSSAYDIVSGNVAVQSSIASGSTFALGTTAVTLTSHDAAGNTSSIVFTVTVQDTAAPIVGTQDNLIVEATSAAGTVVTFTPSALDIVNGAVSVVGNPASGSAFAIGTTTVTLTATDAAGNTGSKTFTVTVRDTTAPVISSPGSLVAEATSAAGAAVLFNASASDLVDGAVSVSSSIASGSTFAIGTTTVTLTTTDAAGNTATATFTVTVRDTTAPVLSTPSNQTVEATGPAGAVVNFAASATDAVGSTIAYSRASGGIFGFGATTVTVTATDAAGNASTGSFVVTVRDTTRPVLMLPASQTIEATSASGAIAAFSGTAADTVSGNVAVVFTPASGTTFALGTTGVVATATDAFGNAGFGGFNIVVRDTTPPVIAAPANLVLEATSASGASATFSATAADIVSGNVPVSSSRASGSTFALGTTTVSLTAIDAAGNASTKSFTVTVRDTTAPTITVPVDIVIDATTVLGAPATYTVTATDLVGGSRPVTLSIASGTTFAIGTTTVTATATDAAGNTATRTFTVTLRAPASAVVNQLSGMNGTINGSIQQLTAQGVALNGGAEITGELLVAGLPTVRLNGHPGFGGTVDSTGATSPSNYEITLNGNATLGHLVRRVAPVSLTAVAGPSNPTGTRNVSMNKSTDPIGAWSTVRDLTLNSNVGNVAVPAGVYGSFTANGGSTFVLGVAGSTTPTVYHFQSLTVNGNATFQIVGPVVIVLKNGLNVNGTIGNGAHADWLDLRISNGGVTLNGNVALSGYVTAPTGTVTVNGNSQLSGGVNADKLVINGGGTLNLLRR